MLSFRTCAAVVAMLLTATPAMWADRHFNNGDLRGAYTWTLEGTFAGTSLVAINQFNADGEGNFSGERTINIGTGGISTTFACHYSVRPNGFGAATCDVELLGRENFEFVMSRGGTRIHFISVTPQAVIRGEARRQ